MIRIETIDEIVAELRRRYEASFAAEPTWSTSLVLERASANRAEGYGWTPERGAVPEQDHIPAMDTWDGGMDRRLHPAASGWRIALENRRRNFTYEVHSDAILDGKVAEAYQAAERLGKTVRRHADREFAALLKGEVSTCTAPFFATHQVRGTGGIGNRITGDFSKTSYAAACAGMRRAGAAADAMIVAKVAERHARSLVEQVKQHNVDASAESRLPVPVVLASDDFDDAPTTYYVAAAGDPRKPFLRQVREPLSYYAWIMGPGGGVVNGQVDLWPWMNSIQFGSAGRDASMLNCPLTLFRISPVVSS